VLFQVGISGKAKEELLYAGNLKKKALTMLGGGGALSFLYILMKKQNC